MELPKIERTGDTWALSWPEHNISYGFERLRETSEGLAAIVMIEADRPDCRGRVLGPVKLNLLSSESQTRLANALLKRAARPAWLDFTVLACAVVAKQYSAPSPTVRLNQISDLGPVEYLVPGLIPVGETTFVYGDSESCKSLLALRIALSIQTGMMLPWGTIPSQTMNVLYLDWETNDRTVGWRLRRLCQGAAGIDDSPDIAYRGTIRGTQAPPLRMLDDEVSAIREHIIRDKIGLVVVDSIGFAVRGKLTDDDVARQAMADLRLLSPATRLVVAHISKESAGRPGGRVDPFGSTFFRAGLRSGFEVRRSEEESLNGRVDLGIWHWKSNDDEHVKPFGLRVNFEDHGGPISIGKSDLMDVQDLATRTPLSTRMRAMLKAGAMNTKELADGLDTSEATVRNTLKRMPDIQQIEIGKKGLPATWGLSAGSAFQ